MEHKDYPGLYQETDEISIKAQSTYLKTIALYLCLLIAAALCSLTTGTSKFQAICTAIIFLATLFLSILLAVKRYDKTWYNARAVAESVKTITWRYMMHAQPYHDTNAEAAKNKFIKNLQEILEQNRQLAQALTVEKATTDAISQKMTAVRATALNERMSLYIADRIEDQLTWYAKKAAYNKRKVAFWFILMCLAQAGALICVLVRVAKPNWIYLPVNIFIVLAGASLTWMQTKKFQDTAAAYSLTAHEIGLLRGQISSDLTEDTFAAFVNDTENAFSREHTQWQARRQS